MSGDRRLSDWVEQTMAIYCIRCGRLDASIWNDRTDAARDFAGAGWIPPDDDDAESAICPQCAEAAKAEAAKS